MTEALQNDSDAGVVEFYVVLSRSAPESRTEGEHRRGIGFGGLCGG